MFDSSVDIKILCTFITLHIQVTSHKHYKPIIRPAFDYLVDLI